MEEEVLLLQQAALDKHLRQKIVDVDPSFIEALNFKLGTKETIKPLLPKAELLHQDKPSFLSRILDNSKTLLRGVRPKTV